MAQIIYITTILLFFFFFTKLHVANLYNACPAYTQPFFTKYTNFFTQETNLIHLAGKIAGYIYSQKPKIYIHLYTNIFTRENCLIFLQNLFTDDYFGWRLGKGRGLSLTNLREGVSSSDHNKLIIVAIVK